MASCRKQEYHRFRENSAPLQVVDQMPIYLRRITTRPERRIALKAIGLSKLRYPNITFALDSIQRRAFQIVDNRIVSVQYNPLALRKDVASLCILYRTYYGVCSDELFNLIATADFRHPFIRRKYHQHRLDG
ncbi:hypothetical protein EVAR_67565_1 [Eumeta japonica]|uniref:Uncharacterized protein n=1 Tax=Eumeta variegata TaxID=151549 RepID=A0A4C1ZJR9_EUMVA|nr:hypothetical protein EVAR_67565_1 [Eumeta japonica]